VLGRQRGWRAWRWDAAGLHDKGSCTSRDRRGSVGPDRPAAERYKRTGEILPESALEEFKKFDSIFLGAIGHPDVKPGILEVGILLKTRFALDQYINLRPVKLYPNVETRSRKRGRTRGLRGRA
jgi:hypothetical protein